MVKLFKTNERQNLSVGYGGSSEEGNLTFSVIYYIYFHNIKQLSFYCMDDILAITIDIYTIDRIWGIRYQKVVQLNNLD